MELWLRIPCALLPKEDTYSKVTALTGSGEMRRWNMEVSARREDCTEECNSVTWLDKMNAGRGMYWDLHFGTYIHAFYRSVV
jgi:hypothetical protein